MRRRQFIAALGGAAAWPVAARSQPREHLRRIGVLTSFAPDDPEIQARLLTFAQGLQELGWSVGRNLRIDVRWLAEDTDDYRKHAAEWVALPPDIFLAVGSRAVGKLQQTNRSVPIVFVQVGDPVGAGFVETLARPGGITTGFMLFEYSIGGKWLELLKEAVLSVKRVAVLRSLAIAFGPGQFGAIQTAASSVGVEVSPINVRDGSEIERAITAFARVPNGGLIVTGGSPPIHRKLIITLAASHRLPAIYPARLYVTEGGLISYGPDQIDQFRRAAGYVDRILKGEKPADLPVQAPTKYELVVNLKTAKALGIELPASVLARADEVIE